MIAKPAVAVIDDDADVRNALKLLFRAKNIPFLLFGDADEFYEGYLAKTVACVLLDLKLGSRNGLDVLKEMRSKNIFIPVILLTGHADVTTTVKALKAGATDVIEKPYKDAELLEKVHTAFAKAENLKKFAAERLVVAPKMEMLTPREIQVIDAMVAGKRNRKIAEELGISTKTLDIHRANIMRKMHTKTVADLVRWRMVHTADEHGVLQVVDKS
jgi:two-component system response regulator FixJ